MDDLEKFRLEEMFLYERQLRSQGSFLIAGIDEAGRGPLAGPVVAAICILPSDARLIGLNDSKQLCEEERDRLYGQIIALPGCDWAVAFADVAEIDRLNILKASFLAMFRALQKLKSKPDAVLVDGHLAPSLGIPTIPIVKGDSKSASIAAASILAKVTRDRIMKEMHELYPQYGFAGHKGYGTPEHLERVRSFGPCAIHRKSFQPIKELFQSIDSQPDLF